MKTLFSFFLTLSVSILSIAAEKTYFYYTQGSLQGQAVEHTGYLALSNFGEACYVGNPWKARTVLKDMAAEDIEKQDVRVWLDQSSGTLGFTYVDTKCLEDSLDATEEGCTATVAIPACGN